MNDKELDRMLKYAASAHPAAEAALESAVMARVRTDDGRAKRWQSFVRWLLILAAVSGVATAAVIGWSLASHDTTHTTPPTMNLFGAELPK